MLAIIAHGYSTRPLQLRREKLRRLVEKAGADALLVTNFINVTYLTGFTGDDSYLLCTARRRSS